MTQSASAFASHVPSIKEEPPLTTHKIPVKQEKNSTGPSDVSINSRPSITPSAFGSFCDKHILEDPCISYNTCGQERRQKLNKVLQDHDLPLHQMPSGDHPAVLDLYFDVNKITKGTPINSIIF